MKPGQHHPHADTLSLPLFPACDLMTQGILALVTATGCRLRCSPSQTRCIPTSLCPAQPRGLSAHRLPSEPQRSRGLHAGLQTPVRLNDVMLRLVTELRWQKFVMFYDSMVSRGRGWSGASGVGHSQTLGTHELDLCSWRLSLWRGARCGQRLIVYEPGGSLGGRTLSFMVGDEL